MRQTGKERRQTLLETALALFSTQGYDGTTTRAIAHSAGVTEALLFKHFRTKQELLAAIVNEYKPERIFSPPPAALHDLPAPDALEQLICRYLDAFWDNRAFMRMVFTTPKSDQAVYAELWAEFARQGLYLYALLSELEDRDHVRRGITASAAEVISTSVSGFLLRVLTDEPSDWQTARRAFISTLLEVVLQGIERKPIEN
jgi:AcrR family transcriptional regulator